MFPFTNTQIMWHALNGSTSGDIPISYSTGNPDRLSYLIMGLERLTQYSVVVYATNSEGRGANSERMNVTTTAVGKGDQRMM